MADDRLPDFLYGTFMQYKQHTEVVGDWLLDNASGAIKQRFGLIPTRTSDNNEQERGYNRSAAPTPSPTQYLPITRNILQRQPRPTIPAGLIESLRRVIALRSEFVDYFARFTRPDIAASNRSHAYFVDVLRQVLSLLSPYETVKPSPAAFPVSQAQEQTSLTAQLANVSVAGPADEANEATPESAVKGEDVVDEDPLAIDHGASQPSNYRLMFAYQCLLKDLGCVYDFVHDQWVNYAAGHARLVTAGVTTEMALEMVVRIEQSFLQSTGVHDDDSDFEILVRDLNDQQQSSGMAGGTGSCFSLQTAYQLAKCLIHNLTLAYGQHIQQLGRSVVRVRHHLPQRVSRGISILDVSNAPSDPGFLSILSDLKLAFKDSLAPCTGAHSCCTSVEDQILTILRKAFSETKIRISTAFAVSVFLMIRRLCASKTHDALAEVDTAAKDIQTHYKRHRTITEAVNRTREKKIPKFAYYMYICGLASGIAKGNGIQQYDQYQTRTNVRQYLGASPLACGIVTAFLQVTQGWSSIVAVDERQTVLSMLHFYNVAKQRGVMEDTWDDMEYLIEKHDTRVLFHGDRPHTWEECFNQFRLAFNINVDPSTVYEGRKAITRRKDAESEEVFLKGTMPTMLAIKTCICRHYLKEANSGLQDIELVLSAISSGQKKAIKQLSFGKLLDRHELFKIHDRAPNLGPLELLRLLQTQVEEEQTRLSFDYAALERRCWELLESMKHAMEKADNPVTNYGKDKDMDISKWHWYQLSHLITEMAFMDFALTNTGLAFDNMMSNDHAYAVAKVCRGNYELLVAKMAAFVKKRGAIGVTEMNKAPS